MKNKLTYTQYDDLVEKVASFLHSLGIKTVRDEDGENEPLANLVLALIAFMRNDVAWGAVTNCLFAIVDDARAAPLLRFCAVALKLHVLTSHPVAPRHPASDEEARQCREALWVAAFHMSAPNGINYLADTMEKIFRSARTK